MKIGIIGAFDTKEKEHRFLGQCLVDLGWQVFYIDVGGLRMPEGAVDLTSETIAKAGGCPSLEALHATDRAEWARIMSKGAADLVADLVLKGDLSALIGLGGSGGTAVSTAAMRRLPLGFPKVMVSTMASGNVAPYVSTSDIIMVPSIVDVAGLNSFLEKIIQRAAAALDGILRVPAAEGNTKPRIAASMFGNTTQCVERARASLEESGYEVLVFHATGSGGRTMESIVESHCVEGVLDITTTEWADEYLGGTLAAGPTRLEAAARSGTPAIVVPGCLDMCNFGCPDSVPDKFKNRLLYEHNPQVTLMRTSEAECRELGTILADKVNQSTGLVEVVLPIKGISVISLPNGPFYDPQADRALFEAIQSKLSSAIPCHQVPTDINAPEFADFCAERLRALMTKAKNL